MCRSVASESARYKLHLGSVKEVSWGKKEGTLRAGDYYFSVKKEIKIIDLEQVVFLFLFFYTTE